jgi:hypothetical protein
MIKTTILAAKLCAISLLAILISGCANNEYNYGNSDNCNSLINSIVSLRGMPEKIDTNIEEDASQITYIYFTQGYGVIFKWGTPYNGCDARDFRFEPLDNPMINGVP